MEPTPKELPEEAMEAIRKRVARGAGLEPPEWVLRARVCQRMDSLALDADAYAEELRRPGELASLVELLRVGETKFFRHQSHLHALEELVLPTLRASRGELRVWSAGCATGEEPYTLAMMLTRALSERPIRILASDISRSSLEVAKRGEYTGKACEHIPPTYRAYLERRSDERFSIAPKLQRLVEFEERNLSLGPFPSGFDLIFCRNVLIYFSTDAKATALRRLVNALKPGGFLFLGYSESLRDVEGVEAVDRGEVRVYRRPLPSIAIETPPPPPERQRVIATEKVRALDSAEVERAKAAVHGATLKLHGDYSEGERLRDEIRRALSAGPTTLTLDLDGAEFLGEAAAKVIASMRERGLARGCTLRLVATRAGHQRFLRRYHLDSEGGAP